MRPIPRKGQLEMMSGAVKKMKVPDLRTKLQKIGEKKLQGFGASQAANYKTFKNRWKDKSDKGVGQYAGYNPFKKY